jgi:hypothetical protein
MDEMDFGLASSWFSWVRVLTLLISGGSAFFSPPVFFHRIDSSEDASGVLVRCFPFL